MEAGSLVGGKYRLVRQIGKGGMARIWLAERYPAGGKAALKELDPAAGAADLPFRKKRLKAEAMLLRELHHPGIPRFLDLLDLPEGLFLVMEYIEGDPLDQLILKKGPLDPLEVREILLQTAEILRYLHGQDPPILHRDIKPGNLILGKDGRIRLIDFGTAERQTAVPGNSLGTRGYAAPEQERGDPQDGRTDLYALGVSMEQMLTGRLSGKMVFLSVRKNDRFMRVILRRLRRKDPAKRYSSAAELASMLKKDEAQVPEAGTSGHGERKGWLWKAAPTAVLLAVCLAWAGWEVADQRLLSLPAAKREEACYRGIRKEPDSMRCWKALLELYLEDGALKEEECSRFLSAYSEAKGTWVPEREEVWRFCFAMAESLFLHYGGANNSFRSRLLLALPYFQNVADFAPSGESICMAARHICRIGGCYQAFLKSDEGKREELETALRQLMEECLQDPAVREDPELFAALRREWEDLPKEGSAALSEMDKTKEGG